jgi:hypothetical protein
MTVPTPENYSGGSPVQDIMDMKHEVEGLKPSAPAPAPATNADAINAELDRLDQVGRNSPTGAMSPEEAKRYEELMAMLPRPTSKEEYDQLPAGSSYIGPDGKQRRKS